MQIRTEAPSDIPAIRRVIADAFGQALEADLVAALRESGDAALSLLAEADGGVVGHLLFSALQAPDRCLALAPLAVAPSQQRRGIGSALVREGLALAKSDGWQAVFVLGEPAYYQRFGFDLALAAPFETDYPKTHFMALELGPGALKERAGPVIYAPAFLALE